MAALQRVDNSGASALLVAPAVMQQRSAMIALGAVVPSTGAAHLWLQIREPPTDDLASELRASPKSRGSATLLMLMSLRTVRLLLCVSCSVSGMYVVFVSRYFRISKNSIFYIPLHHILFFSFTTSHLYIFYCVCM